MAQLPGKAPPPPALLAAHAAFVQVQYAVGVAGATNSYSQPLPASKGEWFRILKAPASQRLQHSIDPAAVAHGGLNSTHWACKFKVPVCSHCNSAAHRPGQRCRWALPH